jgi:hypothetical protein
MANRKRALALGAVALSLGITFVGDAGAVPLLRTSPRVERVDYDTPAVGAFLGVPGPVSGGVWYANCAESEGAGCVILHLRPKERYADIQIKDSLGLPVRAFVFAPGASVHFAEVCSSTKKPLYVADYSELWLDIVAGSCYEEAGPSAPSSGTVIGTYYRSRNS